MKQIKVNPNNEKYYSSEFIKGFNCGAQRQFEADMADRNVEGKQKWTCARCGCENHADFKWCFHCGFHKPEIDQTERSE